MAAFKSFDSSGGVPYQRFQDPAFGGAMTGINPITGQRERVVIGPKIQDATEGQNQNQLGWESENPEYAAMPQNAGGYGDYGGVVTQPEPQMVKGGFFDSPLGIFALPFAASALSGAFGAGAGAGEGMAFGGESALQGSSYLGGGAGAAGATGGGMWDYGDFLQSIGIDPSSTLFQGGGSMSDLTGGVLSNGTGGFDWSNLTGGTGGGSNTVSTLLKALGGNSGLLGTALGGLLGATSASSKPAGSTTTTTDIPDWLKPYVTSNLLGAAGAQSGLTGTNQQIMGGAIPEYLKTVSGAYLDPSTNPWLDATYKHAADLVGSGVDSRFESAGRYGSGAHQGVLGETLGNLATNIYGGNYQTERGRQASAVMGAPNFSGGVTSSTYAPYTGFADLLPTGLRSTSTPYFSNQAGGILSGALAGSQLSKLFG